MTEDWQKAHQELRRLARARAGLDFEEGRWLLLAWRSVLHARLGYGSFREYVERLFGYGARLVQDKLRVAEALEGLPVLAEALRSGRACWSVLRELTRVATPETEDEWLAAAEGRTVREVERLVSGLAPGSQPSDARDPALARYVLRFEVTGEVLASFREALSKLRRDAGEVLDDDAALLLMARAVLQGPSDEGRSTYQVALTVCESCQRAVQQGAGELVEVGPELVEMAACDGQHLGRLDESTGLAAGTHDAQRAHGGAELADASATTARAVQTIPPAIRRLVLRRDGGRCVVPSCRHATWLDTHHLETRAEGGGHDPNNLVTLCAAHHRALHRGELVIERAVTTGLTFRHADGSAYGGVVSPSAVDAAAKAFRALRRLGFGEGEARRALTQAAHMGGGDSVETWVRRCLGLLTERCARAS
jgi:hypothetical protein